MLIVHPQADLALKEKQRWEQQLEAMIACCCLLCFKEGLHRTGLYAPELSINPQSWFHRAAFSHFPCMPHQVSRNCIKFLGSSSDEPFEASSLR